MSEMQTKTIMILAEASAKGAINDFDLGIICGRAQEKILAAKEKEDSKDG